MKTIGQVLRKCLGNVVKVGPTESVRHALDLMAQHDVAAVLVMEEDSLLGIMTELDYVRKVALKHRASDKICVAEIMTSRVFCATPYMTLDHAITLASERNVRHLPVIDIRKGAIGVLSTRDLIREKLAEQSFGVDRCEQALPPKVPVGMVRSTAVPWLARSGRPA